MAARKAANALPPLPTLGVPVHVRLQQLRTERCLSQAEFAQLAGIQQCTLSRLEAGLTRLPQGRTIEHLATAFGLSTPELRRAIGMHGPLYQPAPRDVARPQVALSTRAQQVATVFDRLTPAQQQYLEGMLLQWTAGTHGNPLEKGANGHD